MDQNEMYTSGPAQWLRCEVDTAKVTKKKQSGAIKVAMIDAMPMERCCLVGANKPSADSECDVE